MHARSSPLTAIRAWLVLFAGCSLLGHAEEPTIKLHFIDVGQANATLIEAKCGAVLIDAGAQDDEAVAKLTDYLDSFFRRRRDLNRSLAMVGITHNHIDHTRALRAIVEKFSVKRYIDNGQLEGAGTQHPRWLRKQVADGNQQMTITEILNDDVLAVPGRAGLTNADIDPLHCADCDPVIRVLTGRRSFNPAWAERDFDNKNNHSIVWRIDFGKLSLLISGDLEDVAIHDTIAAYAGTDTLDVDLYHVGHHGSHNGTTPAFLEAMTPTRAIISMGRWDFGLDDRNPFTTFRYGHPRLMIIRSLENHVTRRRARKVVKVARAARDFIDYPIQKAVHATGWDGNIVMSSKRDAMLRVRINQ